MSTHEPPDDGPADPVHPPLPTRAEIDRALRAHRPEAGLLDALDAIPFPDGGRGRPAPQKEGNR